MPDPEPSDPNGANSVNRVQALITAQLRLLAVDATDIVLLQARLIPPEFESLAEQLECQANYRMWYDAIRSEVNAGPDCDEIRNLFEDIAENSGKEANAVHNALEDALAGSPPKGENRRDPYCMHDSWCRQSCAGRCGIHRITTSQEIQTR